MIFVQIASYRDPELLPTIRDCIANARWPGDLRFGVCEQDDKSVLKETFNTSQFRIDFIPWREARGLCWARARIQRLYNGEELTLQIDSHHRFAKHWDETLIAMLDQTRSRKPIIGSYAGIYDPATNEKISTEPFKMVADRFTEGGTILFMPHVIQGWRDLSAPVRARFVSGHFAFTVGKFCEEITPDPQCFFAGEEIAISIRSFTKGYDAFHPHRIVLWHEYTRAGRTKIWDDDPAWHEKDAISKRRLRKLLREEENDSDLTGFDLGTVRSHAEYEVYAGISFANRTLTDCARRGEDPPCVEIPGDPWFKSFHCHSRAHCAACRNDPEFRASLVASCQVRERDFGCPFSMDPPSPFDGPGTRLARLLKRIGFNAHAGCSCDSMALKMNLWRGDCADHTREILAAMNEASRGPANPLKIPWSETIARLLIRKACANARKTVNS